MVRKMPPIRALEILRFTPKYAAKDLSLAIKTALSSAKQSGLDEGVVFFKALEINGGPVMKRFTPASKGRALPYKKRMSHIKIVLSDESRQAMLSDEGKVKSDRSEKVEQKEEK